MYEFPRLRLVDFVPWTTEKERHDIYFDLGQINHKKGHLEEALYNFNWAVNWNAEKNPLTFFYRGNVHYDMENFDAAARDYRLAIKEKEDFSAAMNNLGVALHKKGNMEEALECYRKALELNPDLEEASRNLLTTTLDNLVIVIFNKV